jgi:hypothetical protein
MSIHHEGVSSLKRVTCLGAWLAVSGMLLLPGRGIAQNITMQDGGSTSIINPGNGTGLAGVNSWSVDTLNQSQLNQQWFFYSIQGVNGGVARSIDTIGAASVTTLSGADGINDVRMTYANSQLSASIEYILTGNGAGSGSADMQEAILLQNVGSSTITLSFFQYSDFNLLGGQNDTVHIFGSPGSWTGATQTAGGTGGSGLAELINAPNANHAEANTVGSTLYRLNNEADLTLSDIADAGSGDVTWALQWTTTLNPGGKFEISKDKGLAIQIVPEPGTTALAMLGGLCLMGWTIRRRHPAP